MDVMTTSGGRRSLAGLAGLAVLALLAALTPSAAAATDRDRDGLADTFETGKTRTSPTRADTDGDGLRDDKEDPDRDWLTNIQEQTAWTHPRRVDTDGDGISDANEDPDQDGLRTGFEFRAGTHPRRLDTDGDGLRDGAEDPDGDGLNNYQEQSTGTLPNVADTDGDGTRDDFEDPDVDTLWNRTEFRAQTKPKDKDTDRDGLRDDREDPDRDGLRNAAEQLLGTHPRLADTDADGTRDGDEDSDDDGVSNLVEIAVGLDPLDPDTDGDGTIDGDELPPTDGSPLVAGCPILPTTNVWNIRIDDRPVASNSGTLITTIGATRGLHMDFGSYAGYGIPYNVVDSTTQLRTVTFQWPGESDAGPYPIPPSPLVEGAGAAGDRHILLIDRDTCTLYELYDARTNSSGQWLAGSGAIFDLRSNALRPAGWTSADAAGLPILPGLIRYDEVAAGEILHAVRFTTNETRNTYIYPARHQASDNTGAQYPPMGLRVRLKATANLTGLHPHARTIAEAMQRYGMILADNGSPWYVTGVSDSRFDDDVLHQLDRFEGSDFEVVDTTGLVNGP
jgi:hypothetical protein